MKRNSLLTCGSVVWLLVTGGCTHSGSVRATTSETHTARGEPFATGNASYDEFFEEVRGLKAESLQIEGDEPSAQKPLQTALGSEKGARPLLVEQSKTKATELAHEGIVLRLDVRGLGTDGKPAPGEKVDVELSGADAAAANPKAKTFSDGVLQTSKAEGDLLDRYARMALRARKMKTRVGPLQQGISKEFGGKSNSDRKAITDELSAAGETLDQVAQKGAERGLLASAFLRDLEGALGGPATGKGKHRKAKTLAEEPAAPAHPRAEKSEKSEKPEKRDAAVKPAKAPKEVSAEPKTAKKAQESAAPDGDFNP